MSIIPALVTLTGEDDETLGRSKRKKKKVKSVRHAVKQRNQAKKEKEDERKRRQARQVIATIRPEISQQKPPGIEPEEASPEEATPEETAPEETTPEETAPEEAVREEAVTEAETSGMQKIIIPENELGIFELSTDEQLAKKIYEATGDKVFKGFLPASWNTNYITKMRDAAETLKAAKKYDAINMSWKVPEVSLAAHTYFIKNVDKIKGFIDNPADVLKPISPILWIAGIAAGAFLLAQIVPIVKTLKR